MERLVHWQKLKKSDLINVENPFFAVGYVRNDIFGRREIPGVVELLEQAGVPSYRAPTGDEAYQALKRVEEGEWLLLKREITGPFDQNSLWVRRLCWDLGSTYCKDTSGLTGEGAGKWKTVSIASKKLWSAVAMVGNATVAAAEERPMLTAQKDYANIARVVTQRWVPLRADQSSFARSSAIHRYGKTREITQFQVEADDTWPQSGKSWHWRPVVADEVYEFKEG